MGWHLVAITMYTVCSKFFIRDVMRGHLKRNELIGVLIIEDAAAPRSARRPAKERDSIKYLARNAGRSLACN